jgi:hypothetical protein
MPTMPPADFVAKWAKIQQKETAVAIAATYDQLRKSRALTNLYNGLQYYRATVGAGRLAGGLFVQAEFAQVTRRAASRSEIEHLADLHRGLDAAVFAAYGWPAGLSDEEMLERLLALNLIRAGQA